MTNAIAAAYLATNALLTAGYTAITNRNTHFACERYGCQNACVVERSITCPACENVATQQVDITDVYDHYQALRQSDLRIRTLLLQVAAGVPSGPDRMEARATLNKEPQE